MSTTNRTAVKLALQAKLVTAFPTLQVTYGFPDEMQRESIYVGATRGTMQIADIKAGRKRRIDEFSIDVWFVAGEHGKTAEANDARCEVLVAALDDTLAGDLTLGGVSGLKSAIVGDYDGPDPAPMKEGWASMARVSVDCESRFT